jgi:hypothetical protein
MRRTRRTVGVDLIGVAGEADISLSPQQTLQLWGQDCSPTGFPTEAQKKLTFLLLLLLLLLLFAFSFGSSRPVRVGLGE